MELFSKLYPHFAQKWDPILLNTYCTCSLLFPLFPQKTINLTTSHAMPRPFQRLTFRIVLQMIQNFKAPDVFQLSSHYFSLVIYRIINKGVQKYSDCLKSVTRLVVSSCVRFDGFPDRSSKCTKNSITVLLGTIRNNKNIYKFLVYGKFQGFGNQPAFPRYKSNRAEE